MRVKYEYAVTLDVRGVDCEPYYGEFYYKSEGMRSLRAQTLPAILWRRERHSGAWEVVARRSPNNHAE